MTRQQHRTDAGLATALRISVSRLARRLRVERTVPGLAEPDLSDTQLAALAALERHGAMTPGELAAHEKVQPPSMTRVISALVESQLVPREPHLSDRRQVVLTVTDGRPRSGEQGPPPAGCVAGEAAGGTDPAGTGHAAGGRADPGEAQPVLSEAAPAPAQPGQVRERAALGAVDVAADVRSLSTRNYRLFATGQVVSNTGTWMQRVAQDWLVLELTHGSGTALGIVTGLQFLPQLLFSLWGGVIADRYPQAHHPADNPGDHGGARAHPRRARADRRRRTVAGVPVRFRPRPGRGGGQPGPADLRGRDGRPGGDGERHRAQQRDVQPGQDRWPGRGRAGDRRGRHPGGFPGQRRLLRRRPGGAEADAGRPSCAR